jgi:hypothetical protein
LPNESQNAVPCTIQGRISAFPHLLGHKQYRD